MADRRGFTLVELVIVVTIVGILASAALPIARWSVKRSKEHELREALRTIRMALDRYHDAASAGLVELPEGSSGYPATLELLVEGVPLVSEMPTPAPPAIGSYASSGAGVGGGLEGMARAAAAAAGGEPGGSGLAASAVGARGGVAGSQRPLGSRRSGQSDAAAGSSGSSRFDFSFSFGNDSDSDGGGVGDGEAAEPLVGPDGQPILLRLLRRLPVDPMTGEADWGLRCYGEPPEDRLWCGTDVFDVYSRSLAQAIDGSSYRDW